MKKILKLTFLTLCISILTGCSSESSDALTSDNGNSLSNIGESESSRATRYSKEARDKQTKMVTEDATSDQAKQQPVQAKKTNNLNGKNMDLENLEYKNKFKGATISTNLGEIEVELFIDDSPATVNNFMKLADDGFYEGTKFHRIIEDFMIQCGDPSTKDDSKKHLWGTGGPGYSFNDEINSKKLVRGSLAMANSGPNTNGSQFFIVTKEETSWLDGKHTNFGHVTKGMDIVEKIEKVAVDPMSNAPLEPIVIEKIILIEK